MQYKAISKFQSNKRDLSIIIPENILANEIISSISTLKISEIQNINIFDVYKGRVFWRNEKYCLELTYTVYDRNFRWYRD